jgi:hypothetical protein
MRLNPCQDNDVIPETPKQDSILGISLKTLGKSPINGLRHKPENGTNGWYLWCGDKLSESADFFEPIHFKHIKTYLPEVIEYLDLPPGYRFLIDRNGYEDVWFDSELLKT